MPKICVVASRKGGVGKSTIAYEVATVLGAVLVDLEWDGGGVSGMWGYRPEDRRTDPLMDAIAAGRTPRLRRGFRKPDLVAGSPDLIDSSDDVDTWADRIEGWADDWGRDWVVVDTHPGASAPAHGAMAAAHVVLSPTGLRTNDLNGVERLLAEMADFPLVIVPNMVPRVPPAAELKRLGELVAGTPVRIAPPIPYVAKIGTRKRRMAMTAEDPVPKYLEETVEAFDLLKRFVEAY